ncbi:MULTISPECIES: isocitrate lyase/PEP mutase family protein [Rhizobium]|uniref:2-methylisocitrate lyase-like PEP mutase family enzyme n=1 Tax=Rhizobium paranaense TaxID=1650438 RepID=A0A7W9D2B1_9HYPH|nr:MULTISPECIES: isocitrate lyase/phosphoenolpyruvate mutase family protein [Rhizobium]MBB5575132.1 2-methylisocitrate lyase-like PEP mutase family enzyme [Rhizobium paranaense]PST64439.1 isocitrate lyase/phosphoenolpyruvate mutase family protein [Rhizobium sp. SEMIA4064]
MSQVEKAAEFARLHRKGDPLILFNIWDAGSAKVVTEAGAKALATGSWSVAAANGFGDGEAIPLSLLAVIARLISVTSPLPLSVDFEGGYAIEPDAVAANVEKIMDHGAVGINFEDQVVGGRGVHPIEMQVARIRAIREMADRREMPLFINARTDLFLQESDTAHHQILLDEAYRRADAFAEAGASGFFTPGLVDADLIEAVCDRSPLPVNIMVRPTTPDNIAMGRLGVSRISYGPAPYRTVMGMLKSEAEALYQQT